jgi:hypothetical protein
MNSVWPLLALEDEPQHMTQTGPRDTLWITSPLKRKEGYHEFQETAAGMLGFLNYSSTTNPNVQEMVQVGS